jgi:hypothetical protein
MQDANLGFTSMLGGVALGSRLMDLSRLSNLVSAFGTTR